MYFSIDINKHCGLPVIYLGNCVCQLVKEVKYFGVMNHPNSFIANVICYITIPSLNKVLYLCILYLVSCILYLASFFYENYY